MSKNNTYINQPLAFKDQSHEPTPSALKPNNPIFLSPMATINKNFLGKNIKANNSTRKSKPQSIRLQIEVPINLDSRSPDQSIDDISNEKLDQTNDFCQQYDLINESNCINSRRGSAINTIRFQISFDSSTKSPRVKKESHFIKNVTTCSKTRQKSSISTASSGYLSNTSDFTDTETDNECGRIDEAFLIKNQQYINFLSNKRRNSMNGIQDNNLNSSRTRYPTPTNVYDKLDYTAKQRRYSLSSDASSTISLSSSSSSLASSTSISQSKKSIPYTHVNNYTDKDEENIYEEISNFCQQINTDDLSVSKQQNYEQLDEFVSAQTSAIYSNTSSIKRVTPNQKKPAKTNYKREYTVNEIFQNLNNFKEQAIQFEKLYEKPPVFNLPKQESCSESKKSVSFLKQIFESNRNNKQIFTNNPLNSKQMKAESVAMNTKSEVPSIRVAQTSKPTDHIYVNERVIKDVIV